MPHHTEPSPSVRYITKHTTNRLAALPYVEDPILLTSKLIYYLQEVPLLYLPNAKVVWNGNIVPSSQEGLRDFLSGIPFSRHDLQTLDCHPVAGQ